MWKNAALLLAVVVITAVLGSVTPQPCFASQEAHSTQSETAFPPDLQGYDDAGQVVLTRLTHRIEANPFNLVGTLIFLLAIVHTFLTGRFREMSHRLEQAYERKIEEGTAPLRSVSQASRLLHFLGEVEVVFGLWAIPLLLSVVYFFDWHTVVRVVNRFLVNCC